MNTPPGQNALDQRLREIWTRRQRYHFSAGCLALLSWAIPLFMVCMLADWLITIPAIGRIILLIILLLISVRKAWSAGWKELRAFNAAHIALLVEEKLGNLESLLVSAVQLKESDNTLSSSDMRALTIQAAESKSSDLMASTLISFQGLRRAGMTGVVFILLILVFAIINGPFLRTGFFRILPPWASIDYPTRTQMTFVSKTMVIKEGDPAAIEGVLSGEIPKEARLELRTGTGKPRLHKLPVHNETFSYTVASAFRSFEYRVKAGDSRSKWRQVNVIPSPGIAAVQVTLDYPDYTDKETDTIDALTLTVPEKTFINWNIKLDRPVSDAECILSNGNTIPLTVSADGVTISMSQSADFSQSYNFRWTEKKHGFVYDSPNHFLQVAPDQPPRVELTQPSDNLYATLGRPLEFKYRARDDHGIGKSFISYHINKTEETRIPISNVETADGSESGIDWDYRATITNIVIGDNVSFLIECSDRYPGKDGVHTARSQSRRITFLSKSDYLKEVARLKKRLLLQLKSIYREERTVHALIRDLDPLSDIFAQTCQIEAVRQDLIKERLMELKLRMDALLLDLDANSITNKSETATFESLAADLESIATTYIGGASKELRQLASAAVLTNSQGPLNSNKAVSALDNAARELAIQILNVGYKEATEVMARELHAIAEAQAVLRLNTSVAMSSSQEVLPHLGREQAELHRWLNRLLASLPIGKESTEQEALIAFTLTRLSKELKQDGMDNLFQMAESSINDGALQKAITTQSDISAMALRAEFRLRQGAEHEALVKAEELFALMAKAHSQLSHECRTIRNTFDSDKHKLANKQKLLHNKLQLLLLPTIPAPRYELYDLDPPETPPISALLTSAENGMKKTVSLLLANKQKEAAELLSKTSKTFDDLSAMTSSRITSLNERESLANAASVGSSQASDILLFIERQLSLLEKAEDAEDDSINASYIAPLQLRLLEDLTKIKARLSSPEQSNGTASPHNDILNHFINSSCDQMTASLSPLKNNKPNQAIKHQESALAALEQAAVFLTAQSSGIGYVVRTLNDSFTAHLPGPYIADIRDEQLDLLTRLDNAEKQEYPRIAVVQKNLIHAVNAILDSLESMLHHVESGTTMLFAKEDMDAASAAIIDNDLVEAIDAGSYVAESMEDLHKDIRELAPQYQYIVEITEHMASITQDTLTMQAKVRLLLNKLEDGPEMIQKNAFSDALNALHSDARELASRYERACGQPALHSIPVILKKAVDSAQAKKTEEIIDLLYQSNDLLLDSHEGLLEFMKFLSATLAAPPEGTELSEGNILLLDVLAITSEQLAFSRQTAAENADTVSSLADRQEELSRKLSTYTSKAANLTFTSDAEELPILLEETTTSTAKFVAAEQHIKLTIAQLRSNDQKNALKSQRAANDALRHFICDYILMYVVPAGPPAQEDPALSDASDPVEDTMVLFMPGQISGAKPKGGRVDWQVLGQRERAALNENFARELPLEYRAILKSYYERLAQ